MYLDVLFLPFGVENMPGLKGKKEDTPIQADKAQGLDNILAIMEKREKTELPADPIMTSEDRASAANKTPEHQETVYSKIFATVGNTTRRRYESDKMPHLHLLLFNEIKAAIAASGPNVKLGPILEKLDITRASAMTILSCLEAYGYLRLEREKGKRSFVFQVLRRGDHVV
jgi:hypothetical protein